MITNNQKGASLVVTLIVLTTLAVVAVAMIANTSLDRVAVTSSANIYRAQLAAEAGVSSFVSKITTLMAERPLHSIGYTLEEGEDAVAHPIFFGAETYSGETPVSFLLNSSNLTLNALPAFDSDNSVNINVTESIAGERGWIGSPIRKIDGQWLQTTPVNRSLWVNILADPSLPNQPNPNESNYNPVVGRYAYWVEDETAKVNLRVSGNNELGGAFSRNLTVSSNTTELDIGAVPLDHQATPNKPLPMGQGASAANNSIVEFMQENQNFPAKYRMISFIEGGPVQGIDEEDIKFHITYDSTSNELAGTGRRRANLNHIVTNSLDPDEIAADLDDIIYVITGEHTFRNRPYHGDLSNSEDEGVYLAEDNQENDTKAMPEFGRRFYTTPAIGTGITLKEDHEKTYLLKLAANIRDYVDLDSQPTFVDFSGEVQAGAPVTTSWLSGEEPIALGKEAIPYFQEHVWRGRFISMSIVAGTIRQISFTMDHYFEFYNPSNKDWTAPQGASLLVRNLPEMDAGTLPWIELPDFDIDLSGLVVPAGTAVVITTAPQDQDPPGLIPAGANVFRASVPATARSFNNVLGNVAVGGSRRGLRIRGRSSTNFAQDYLGELIFTTNLGFMSSFPALTLAGNGSPFEMTLTADGNGGTWAELTASDHHTRYTWAHSLAGNNSPSRSGDPRSLIEMMEFVAGSDSNYGRDQARFFSTFSGVSHMNQSLPGQYSSGNPRINLTNPSNPEYVSPTNWPDYHPQLLNSSSNSYAVIADNLMSSVGEFGHIYDPHRKISLPGDGGDGFTTPPEETRIRRARGGGRSLKVGQREDLVGNSRFSPATAQNISWFNGAWRLTDIFSADESDIPESPNSAEGKININGVLRDDGTAFRAALRNLTFQPAPDGDPARQGQLLSESEMDEIISQIRNYLQTNGPMLCRGELGQIPFFSASGMAGTAGGQPSSTSMDRSREEIFRRIVELITTRSLSFKLYVIGQAVRQNLDGSLVPIATSHQQCKVKLEPQIEEEVNSRATGYTARVVDTLSL